MFMYRRLAAAAAVDGQTFVAVQMVLVPVMETELIHVPALAVVNTAPGAAVARAKRSDIVSVMKLRARLYVHIVAVAAEDIRTLVTDDPTVATPAEEILAPAFPPILAVAPELT